MQERAWFLSSEAATRTLSCHWSLDRVAGRIATLDHRQNLVMVADRTVAKGEELTIVYTSAPDEAPPCLNHSGAGRLTGRPCLALPLAGNVIC